MKKLLFYVLLTIGLTTQLQAQDNPSNKIEQQAKADAKNFVLDDANWKKFRHDRNDYIAQYKSGPKPFSNPNPFARSSNPLNITGIGKIREEYNKIDFYADYFKPSKALVSDTTLLSDSVYVAAFRAAAYKNTTNRHTTGHYVAIIGGITSALVLITIFLIAASNGDFS